MVEIASYGPNIQQRHIAARLGITPQAISEYIHQLVDEGYIVSKGRSSYEVSIKGVNWMLEMFRELNGYVSLAAKAVTNITICAAIAECNIAKGQTVGLKMKDGFLYATTQVNGGAKGTAQSSVSQGEDITVSNIEGLVELNKGKITIIQVPSVRAGGSRSIDSKNLKTMIDTGKPVGVIGIEALVALRRANIEPTYLFGVTEAAIEAVHCGLPFIVVCTDDAIPGLIKRLQEEQLEYNTIDLTGKIM